MRALNARQGLNRDQDTLPKKLSRHALKGGRTDGAVLDETEFSTGINMYYQQAGWDNESGIPTRETLEATGLAWAADELGL
jgi:aldehyde:ferredoxin oxidoreductase